MKNTAIFMILMLAFSFTMPAQSAWVPQTSGTTNDLYGVFFLNNDYGYAVGDNGTILFTIDGGGYWTTQTSGTPILILLSVFFTDSLNGIAVGGYHDITYTTGVIKRTMDGGTTWVEKATVPNNFLRSVYFIGDTGFVAGDDGSLLKTNDKGATWSTIPTGIMDDFYAVYFKDINEGFITGFTGTIRHTTDGGNTWTAQASGTQNLLRAIASKGNTCYTVGQRNMEGYNAPILKTTNEGANWAAQTSGINNDLLDIAFKGDIAYAVGGDIYGTGKIIKTNNGGANWTNDSITLDRGTFLTSICFPDEYTGYIVGWGGQIFKTQSLLDVQTPTTANTDLKIYPNPCKGKFRISYNNPKHDLFELKITDASGAEVFKKSSTEDSYLYEGELFAKGVYVVSVRVENIRQEGKLIGGF